MCISFSPKSFTNKQNELFYIHSLHRISVFTLRLFISIVLWENMVVSIWFSRKFYKIESNIHGTSFTFKRLQATIKRIVVCIRSAFVIIDVVIFIWFLFRVLEISYILDCLALIGFVVCSVLYVWKLLRQFIFEFMLWFNKRTAKKKEFLGSDFFYYHETIHVVPWRHFFTTFSFLCFIK